MSSELGNKIRELRGPSLSQEQFAQKVGLSLRTIANIERGDKVRRETLLDIFKTLYVSEAVKTDLLLAWLKLELGKDFTRFRIEAKSNSPSALHEGQSSEIEQITDLLAKTSKRDRENVRLALQRPAVLKSLESFNRLYDQIDTMGRRHVHNR